LFEAGLLTLGKYPKEWISYDQYFRLFLAFSLDKENTLRQLEGEPCFSLNDFLRRENYLKKFRRGNGGINLMP